jgi:enediyne biosynthesis protein E4
MAFIRQYDRFYARVTACDFDQDGDLDVYVSNYRLQPNVLWLNDGTGKFKDVAATYNANFDHDGDLDLVTAAKLFENSAAKGHWLEIRLVGDGNTVNRSAIGTQVRISLPNQTLTRQVEAGTGEGNQNDLVLHFGLGNHMQPARLDILWPTGTSRTIEDVKIDRVITVRFGD